jgi:copper resistance protein C
MLAFTAAATLAAFPLAAAASPHAVIADPMPGAVLRTSPTAIRIVFTEGLSRRSNLKLTDSEGERLVTLPASIGGPDDTRMVVPLLEPLSPGTYTVTWQVFSDGERRTRGKYKFEIAP